MPQSLARIYLHLIFSTKNREPILADSIRPGLHSYLDGILRDLDSPAVEINSVSDHTHLLFCLSCTHAVSEIVAQTKRGSSAWLKTQDRRYATFHWQNGYGVFSVSQSGVDEVREYIRDQQAHHQKSTFQEEYRTFLRRYGIEYDEKYVWD